MDAVRYLEETRRMCRFFLQVACAGCPALINRQNCMFADLIVNYGTKITDAVAIVEKWSKENSIKTRSSELLKHYPDATVDCHGMVDICPKAVDKNYTPVNGCCNTHCDGGTSCDECCCEYWIQEVEL